MSKIIGIQLPEEDISLLVSFLEEVNEHYHGKKSLSQLKLIQLITNLKNALLMSDSRVRKLMGEK